MDAASWKTVAQFFLIYPGNGYNRGLKRSFLCVKIAKRSVKDARIVSVNIKKTGKEKRKIGVVHTAMNHMYQKPKIKNVL